MPKKVDSIDPDPAEAIPKLHKKLEYGLKNFHNENFKLYLYLFSIRRLEGES
jgi:hypothetical protein